ncbi:MULTISPECIES: hypothetical protein [Acetobacteraceae]|uniref:Uncharacterized protein n=2 Tax=Acetobacteraceae TaxID=433 RepID=A0A1U9KLK4_9PROT|nr:MULTISPECIES: hypothetical protein [Acetobacteraceae]AQS86676.1 hypothetical protein A0U93_00495 [Neoasaia chiangmaiensis]NHO33799.1 ornithine cyclodeaminase [Acetobacter fallax]NHO37360.1 ornithine cyclodeaminase [Acetobacter fallax]GBR35781.1 ornithine cyclodeaminase [Neoasaia chiangmaiensis NBRC 101099]GEN16654.1 ornithine cyclodeaminase [Neoasaia chiangmaiensis]
MIVLSANTVSALGGHDILRAIDDVRRTTALFAAGDAGMDAENSVPLAPEAGPHARAYALPAWVGGDYQAAGVKWTAHRQIRPTEEGASVSMTLVNDRRSGALLGAVESDGLTHARTAAVSGVAVGAFRPAGVRHALVIGGGANAHAHVDMASVALPGLQTLAVWSRDPAQAQTLRATHADDPRLHVATSLDDAIGAADTVFCCTSSVEPFIMQRHVRPGLTFVQAGHHEVEFDAITQFDHITGDRWGSFAERSGKSLFRLYRAGGFPRACLDADLTDAVSNAWQAPPQDSLYFSSFGLNIFDIALAARVLKDAIAGGAF